MALLRTLHAKQLLKNLIHETRLQSLKITPISTRHKSTLEYAYEKDPAPTFFKSDVQTLLKTLTRVNVEKVYRKRKMGEKKLQAPQYKFLTDDQLEEALNNAKERVDEMLQMPPVLQIRKPIDEVLSRDPALQGLDTSKIVFTDITFGKKNSERLIVVRETDGTLRKADWDLRDRMNQVYMPIEGRELRIPKLFEEDNMKRLLDNKEYEFVLDSACLQFEPNDPEYHRVNALVYTHVNDNESFELLRSTRHFGPLTFFLTWFKIVDNLLLDLIQNQRADEAKSLIELYGKVHGIKFDLKAEDLIERFVKEHALKKAPLELAMQSFKDLEKQKKELQKGIDKAHGRL